MSSDLTSKTETKTMEIEFAPTAEQLSQRAKSLQIAESTLVEKSDTTTPDAYLSQQTQKVDRQTKAAQIGAFRQARRGGEMSSDKEKTKGLKLSDLGVAINFRPHAQGAPGPRITGQTAATSDHLRNIENGAETLLNTREFAYYSFYQRVRHQLEQFWEPGLRAKLKKMFDRGRQLAADKEHSTRLMIELDDQGIIRRVLIENTSGFLDLDEAAIEAFNRAGPFPNPPKGMLEKDGMVRVEWEFVLKT